MTHEPSEYLIHCVLLSIEYKVGEGNKVSKAKLYNIDKGEIFYHTFVTHKSAMLLVEKYGKELPHVQKQPCGGLLFLPTMRNNATTGKPLEVRYNVKIGKFYHGPPVTKVTKMEEITLKNGC
jgi:hypothetical protein